MNCIILKRYLKRRHFIRIDLILKKKKRKKEKTGYRSHFELQNSDDHL